MRIRHIALFCVIFFPGPALGQRANLASDPVIEKMQIRIEALESDMGRLRGRADKLGFELRQAKREAADATSQLVEMEVQIADLIARLERTESVIALPGNAAAEAINATRTATERSAIFGDPRPPAQTSENAAPPAYSSVPNRLALVSPDLADTADSLFQQARQFLLQGDYPSAELAFSTFVSRYPDNKNTGEAQYWLAESLLIQEAWPEAAEAYVLLLSSYPDTPKAAEGLVRLARALRKMGDLEQACAVLKELPQRYPSASPIILSIAATERARARCPS